MTNLVTESIVEEATLDWFKELGYSVLFGPDIAPDEPAAGRASFSDVVLPKLLSGEVRVKDAADFQRISG